LRTLIVLLLRVVGIIDKGRKGEGKMRGRKF
jgi:hypothetical protein